MKYATSCLSQKEMRLGIYMYIYIHIHSTQLFMFTPPYTWPNAAEPQIYKTPMCRNMTTKSFTINNSSTGNQQKCKQKPFAVHIIVQPVWLEDGQCLICIDAFTGVWSCMNKSMGPDIITNTGVFTCTHTHILSVWAGNNRIARWIPSAAQWEDG